MEFSLREDYASFGLEHTNTGLDPLLSLKNTKISFNETIRLRVSTRHSFVKINKYRRNNSMDYSF